MKNKKAVTARYVCSVFPAVYFEPVRRGATVQSKTSQKTLLNTQNKKVTTSTSPVLVAPFVHERNPLCYMVKMPLV